MGRNRAEKPEGAEDGETVISVKIRGKVADALGDFLDEKAETASDFVRRAVRDKLQQEGFWPRRKPAPS
jgi:hypothetical protein